MTPRDKGTANGNDTRQKDAGQTGRKAGASSQRAGKPGGKQSGPAGKAGAGAAGRGKLHAAGYGTGKAGGGARTGEKSQPASRSGFQQGTKQYSQSRNKGDFATKPVAKEAQVGSDAAKAQGAKKPFGRPAGRTDGKTAGTPTGRPAPRAAGRPGFSSGGRGGHKPYGQPAPKRNFATPAESTGLSMGARRLALNVLREVHQNGAYAGLALNEQLQKSALQPADRRLATSILYGTIENQIRIDFALDRYMERPTNEPIQRDILRLSAYQILFLDRVPDSAAVNEGVNLAKAMDMEGATGFLNAVLRNLVRGKEDIPWPKREDDLREYLHVMGSMPLWIVDLLMEAYGADEAERLIMHRVREHPMVVRPNMLRLTDGEFEALLQKKAWQARRGLAPYSFLVSGAAEIAMDNDYRNGLFSIQGQSSMLAAEAVQVRPGMRVLDACAAPGGKSAYLCESMQNTGRVFAWELHEKRAMLLESTKRRLGLESLRISVRDATEPKLDMNCTLDAVLLDAPCSGLGVMVQKPDLKYRLQQEDIAPIVATQRKLLNTLCAYVKPGGMLVYSTCSILPEENTQQIQRFLEEHPEYTVEPLPDTFPPQLREQQTALGLQLLGYRDEVEGFYIVRLRKAKA